MPSVSTYQHSAAPLLSVARRNWLERYQAGDREAVWTELVELGDEVREPSVIDEATEVARETMDRARLNIQKLRGRLQRVGYQFEYPDLVFRPPTTESRLQLDQQESEIGPLPLSLRAFYEVVGTVDFTQSRAQLVQHHRPDRQTAGELLYVGEYDPLVVGPLIEEEDRPETGEYFFACDEFHKANYSGGENYHVGLPGTRADFPIIGMYGIGEFFIPYLRATFAGGGFRGRVRRVDDRYVKHPPNLALTAGLAEGLLAI